MSEATEQRPNLLVAVIEKKGARINDTIGAPVRDGYYLYEGCKYIVREVSPRRSKPSLLGPSYADQIDQSKTTSIGSHSSRNQIGKGKCPAR